MKIMVLLFFMHNTLATALLGVRFLSKGGTFSTYFGIGLLFDAVAFGAWGAALVSPENLPVLVTTGAVLALLSFLLFLKSGIVDLPSTIQTRAVAIGAIFIAATFVAGRYIFPTPKFVSDEGFLFFNLHPFVQVMYITALVIAAFPAMEKAGSMFRGGYSMLVKFLLAIQVIGTIVLITNTDTLSLIVVGWCMGLSYFLLWTMLLFRRGIWLS